MLDVSEKDYVLSVTEALEKVKTSLEEFVLVIRGEVSDLKISSSYAAIYFSLKDDKSKLPCLIWKNRYEDSPFDLEEGMLINVVGRFSVFSKNGKMNFNVFEFQPAGVGAEREKVAKLIEKLDKLGFFEESNKKEIPAYPEKIGVITSPAGAVIHDILRTIRRRTRGLEISFYGVKVEGDTAKKQMCEAIRTLDKENLDVILLARGGGSFEDMMPFNDEDLAQEIFECSTPIITGIGHEPDTTIADLISDFRASTPTAAAEIITRNLVEVSEKLQDEVYVLSDTLSTILGNLTADLEKKKLKLENLSPSSTLEQQKMRFDFDLAKMFQLKRTLVNARRAKVISLAKRLDVLSPLSVLTRGYAYAQSEDSKVIKSTDDCDVADIISVTLVDGALKCEVKDKGGRNDS